MTRPFLRILKYAMLASLIAGALFFGIAVASALLPLAGRQQTQSTDQPPIFVCADDVHADFVFPAHDEVARWDATFPDIRVVNTSDNYLAIGWGDLMFFTELPTWGDVRPRHVYAAFTGQNDVALRVLAVGRPSASEGCVPLQLDNDGREALIAYIKRSLKGEGQAAVLAPSYAEAYYLANGRYGPFHTCNQWIAAGLGVAGIRHAWFSPFSFGVVWPLR